MHTLRMTTTFLVCICMMYRSCPCRTTWTETPDGQFQKLCQQNFPLRWTTIKCVMPSRVGDEQESNTDRVGVGLAPLGGHLRLPPPPCQSRIFPLLTGWNVLVCVILGKSDDGLLSGHHRTNLLICQAITNAWVKPLALREIPHVHSDHKYSQPWP